MSTISWCDRKNYKKIFKNWLELEDRFLAFSVTDSQELGDITNWIKYNSKDYSIGTSIYETDVQIQKQLLLRYLTFDLGQNEKFQNFYELIDRIDKEINTNQYSIKQEIGTNSSGIKNEFEGNQQIINILPGEPISQEDLKERRIEQLLNEFINDLKILNTEDFLFLIRFGKDGFGRFSGDFKHWFLNVFCREISLLKNVKICILNQGNLDEFRDFDLQYQEYISEDLKLEDILDVNKLFMEQKHIDYKGFCEGVIDPTNKIVKYIEFKRRLIAYIKRSAVSAQ